MDAPVNRKVLARFSVREIGGDVVRRCGPQASPDEIEAAAYRAGRETVEEVVRRHGRKPRERPMTVLLYTAIGTVVFFVLLAGGCPQ